MVAERPSPRRSGRGTRRRDRRGWRAKAAPRPPAGLPPTHRSTSQDGRMLLRAGARPSWRSGLDRRRDRSGRRLSAPSCGLSQGEADRGRIGRRRRDTARGLARLAQGGHGGKVVGAASAAGSPLWEGRPSPSTEIAPLPPRGHAGQRPMDSPAHPSPAVFRYRAYSLFWAARVFTTLAVQAESVTIGWQVYTVARRTHGVSAGRLPGRHGGLGLSSCPCSR